MKSIKMSENEKRNVIMNIIKEATGIDISNNFKILSFFVDNDNSDMTKAFSVITDKKINFSYESHNNRVVIYTSYENYIEFNYFKGE